MKGKKWFFVMAMLSLVAGLVAMGTLRASYPCFIDTFTFGADSWVISAPPESILATFTYNNQTYPALVAVESGNGRAVYSGGSALQINNITDPGCARHQIFLNSVAWATKYKAPSDSTVLVTWGHRELVTYHYQWQCCSTNIVTGLEDAGYTVGVEFDIPQDLSGYDAVVMPAVGWSYHPNYQNPMYWSGSSGHAPTSQEVSSLLDFITNGGGLVASVEENRGAAWMNPIGNPMGVSFQFVSPASTLIGQRIADHPIFLTRCPCNDPDPAAQGYWHRQCIGLPHDDPLCPGIDPGRYGRGPEEPTEPGFCPGFMDCADAWLEDLDFYGMRTCEGIDADPPSDACEKAEKHLTAMILNVCSDKLQEGCEIDVSAEGCSSTNVGDLIDEIASLILLGDCYVAGDCAAAVNEGDALSFGRDSKSIAPTRAPIRAPNQLRAPSRLNRSDSVR